MSSNQRHKTTLEIGVDDRQVRGLEQTLERTFDPAMVEAFTRALERQQRIMEKHTKLLEKMAQGGTGGGGGGAGGGGGGSGRGSKEPGFFARMASTTAGTMAGNMLTGGYQRAQSGMASAATGSGFVGGMLSGIPVVGPAMGGAVQGINQFYGQYAQQQQAVLSGYGRTGIGNQGMQGLYGAGHKYGLGPGQVAGAMGNYANQTGLSGGALGAVAPQLMAAQQTRGFGSLGSILGGAGAAGGKSSDPAKMMEDAIASGFQIGIRESRMDQYLAQMGGWVESVRNQGINLSMESAAALTNTMGNLGLKGQAGVKAAQNVQSAMARVGTGGGFGQIAALKAAGLGSGKSFMQARAFAEAHPEVIMQKLGKEMSANGLGTEAMALELETLMNSLGINLGGPKAYLNAAEVIQAGGDLSSDAFGQAASGKQKAARGKGIKGAGLGTAKAQSGLERQGQGVGAGVANEAIRLRQVEMRLAKTVLPRFAQAVGGAVEALDHLMTSFDPKKQVNMSAKTVILQAGELLLGGILGEEVDLDGSKSPGKKSPKSGTSWEFENDDKSKVAKAVRALAKGDMEGFWNAGKGGGGGSAKERAAHHARKTAEALEEDAAMSLPEDNQMSTSAN